MCDYGAHQTGPQGSEKKKLTDAGKALTVQDDEDIEALESDMELFNMTDMDLPQEETFDLWPSNLTPFRLFQQCQTQWKYLPMGELSGLDYPGIAMVIKQYAKKGRNRLFKDIQAMEKGYLKGINKQKAP